MKISIKFDAKGFSASIKARVHFCLYSMVTSLSFWSSRFSRIIVKGDTRSVEGWFYGLPLGLLSAKGSFPSDIILVGMGEVFVGEEVCGVFTFYANNMQIFNMTRTIKIINIFTRERGEKRGVPICSSQWWV